ncbi:zinc transporter zitB [Arthroderma uncinatum]|uniref:zinc transporter zitB n=1 Tax=Arthroderma uncinatum TaxID=74035 RepID=UPI00144A8BA4|nr:zinc transporter zitB [Arthroderma uncinatum]KAF3482615.1 zinc transporter zitB [Arthroderma uncinatum]
MSVASISPAINGVRGGRSHRGRGHKRNHGHSINDTQQQFSSYPGILTPPQHTQPSPYLPSSAEQPLPQRYLDKQEPGHVSLSNGGLANSNNYHNHASSVSQDSFVFGHVAGGHQEHSATSTAGLTSQAVSGILTALPFVASYLLTTVSASLSESANSESKSTKTPRPHGLADSPLLSSCAYVAAALLVLGGYGKIRPRLWKESAGVIMPAHTINSNLYEGMRMAFWIGLPLYASFMIGFDLVVSVLLLRLSAGVEAGPKSNMWTRVTQVVKQRKISSLFILAMVALDAGYMSPSDPFTLFKGYLALILTLAFSPSGSLPPPANGAVDEKYAAGKDSVDHAATVNIAVGTILGVLVVFVAMFMGNFPATSLSLFSILLVGLCTAISQLGVGARPVGGSSQPSLASGASLVVLATLAVSQTHLITLQAIRFGLAGLASFIDGRLAQGHSHSHEKVEKKPSRVTLWLLKSCEHWPFIHAILKERDSRRIFYFMNLNLVFMVVQLTYGIVTGSLGLLSDSIHMLFDCFALAVGLAAAVMSKWPPSSRFPYGYGKIDTLAGFGNGVFLMIISVEIIYEAIERLMSGSEVHRIGDLFIVSSLGLVVNMVGIFAFDHAHHGHGHGGHDHDHGHGNENMHGIFLHILADALGSVAVVSSTILVHFFGWSGFDPIASCLIAILIFVSAIPLVISTSKTLLLALPADVEYSLRDTLAAVSVMRGVVGYTVPNHGSKGGHSIHESHSHSHSHGHGHGHAHSHSGHEHNGNRRVLGVIHIIASKNADLPDVQARVSKYLSERGMNVLVQVEREGDGKCWCGGGNRAIS